MVSSQCRDRNGFVARERYPSAACSRGSGSCRAMCSVTQGELDVDCMPRFGVSRSIRRRNLDDFPLAVAQDERLRLEHCLDRHLCTERHRGGNSALFRMDHSFRLAELVRAAEPCLVIYLGIRRDLSRPRCNYHQLLRFVDRYSTPGRRGLVARVTKVFDVCRFLSHRRFGEHVPKVVCPPRYVCQSGCRIRRTE